MVEIEERKIMYHMIISLERDLIEYLSPLISIEDFTTEMINKAESRKTTIISVKNMLEQLGYGDYIELINRCKSKLQLTQNELNFINKNASMNIVEIRNRVMHPKPLNFDDYAILENLFFRINTYVYSIPWINVIDAQKKIKNNPSEILQKEIRQINNTIIDNLPPLDCEELEFIGRGKEIGELKQYILNDNYRITSIVAAGGYGKTALALKVLNDLKKSGKSPFELMIWVSFKTRQLDKTSFIDINEAITDLADMNEFLNDFIGGDIEKIQEELISLAQQFKMLLILDNLETLNHQDMLPFINEYINYGKILITSRVSIGQLDKRFDLNPLNQNDLLEFTNRLLNYYNLDEKFTSKQILNLAEKVLFSNPLSIKWAIRSIAKGATLEEVYKGREDVVEFCMSNVYDKISTLGKNILNLLAFNISPMTFGQIVFYLQKNYEDFTAINDAITQLTQACFLDKIKLKEGKYTLIEQGKIFIDSLSDNEGLKEHFSNKKREISTIHQSINVDSEENPYNNNSITIFNTSEDIIISAYYLFKAVKLIEERKNEEALELVLLAENISDDYSECYKIHGLILSYMENPDAELKYKLAINKSKSLRDKLVQHVAITNYYIKVDNFSEALVMIEKAIKLDPNNINVILEKIKVLLYTGKYSEAESLILSVHEDMLKDNKTKNVFITRKADLMRRKAEQLDEISQVKQRKELLLSAYQLLKSEKYPDDYMYSMICKIINDLAHLSNFNECAEDVLNFMFTNIDNIYKLRAFNEFKLKFRKFLKNLDLSLAIKSLLLFYSIDIRYCAENEGIISTVKENYGFIINQKYLEGIYFYNVNNFKKGEKVSFKIVKYYEKNRAVDVKKIED